jgi:hypothetical protein
MSLTWVVVTWTLRDKCPGGGGVERQHQAWRGPWELNASSRPANCRAPLHAYRARRFTIVFKKATTLSPSLPPHSSVPYTGLVMPMRSQCAASHQLQVMDRAVTSTADWDLWGMV